MTAFPSTWVNPLLVPSGTVDEKSEHRLERGRESNLGKHTCTTNTGLGYKKEPAFRFDVLKHAAKGG